MHFCNFEEKNKNFTCHGLAQRNFEHLPSFAIVFGSVTVITLRWCPPERLFVFSTETFSGSSVERFGCDNASFLLTYFISKIEYLTDIQYFTRHIMD